jgi:hypothetical protein
MPTIKDVVVSKPDSQQTEMCQQWPIWECKASTFDWDYTQTETCLLIEGEVTVTDRPAGADSVTFGPGDMVVFPVGLKCIWQITKDVKKHYNFE